MTLQPDLSTRTPPKAGQADHSGRFGCLLEPLARAASLRPARFPQRSPICRRCETAEAVRAEHHPGPAASHRAAPAAEPVQKPARSHPDLCRHCLRHCGGVDRCQHRAGRRARQHHAWLRAGIQRQQRRREITLPGHDQIQRAARMASRRCCPPNRSCRAMWCCSPPAA